MLLPPVVVEQILLLVLVPEQVPPDRPEGIRFVVHQTRLPGFVHSPAVAVAVAGHLEESRLGSHHSGNPHSGNRHSGIHHSGNHRSGTDRCRNWDLVVHQNLLLRLHTLPGSVRSRRFGTHSDFDLEELRGRFRRKAGILSLARQDSELLQWAPAVLLLQELALVLVVAQVLLLERELEAVGVVEEAQEDLL